MLFVVVICIIVLFVFILTVSYYPPKQKITKGGWLIFKEPDDYKKYLIKRDNPINVLRIGSAPLHNFDDLSKDWDATDPFMKKLTPRDLDKIKPISFIPELRAKSYDEYEFREKLIDINHLDPGLMECSLMHGELINKIIKTSDLDYRSFISKVTPLDRVIHVALNDDSDVLDNGGIFNYGIRTTKFNLSDIGKYGYTFSHTGVRYIQLNLLKLDNYNMLKNLPVHDDPNDRIMDYDFIIADDLYSYNFILPQVVKYTLLSNIMKKPGLYIQQFRGKNISETFESFRSKTMSHLDKSDSQYRIALYDNIYSEELREWIMTHIPKLAEEHIVASPLVNIKIKDEWEQHCKKENITEDNPNYSKLRDEFLHKYDPPEDTTTDYGASSGSDYGAPSGYDYGIPSGYDYYSAPSGYYSALIGYDYGASSGYDYTTQGAAHDMNDYVKYGNDPIAMKLPFYISMFIFGRAVPIDVDLMKTEIIVIYRE